VARGCSRFSGLDDRFHWKGPEVRSDVEREADHSGSAGRAAQERFVDARCAVVRRLRVMDLRHEFGELYPDRAGDLEFLVEARLSASRN